MSSYSDYKKKSLENPDIKAAYDELQQEYDRIQTQIDAKNSQNRCPDQDEDGRVMFEDKE